MNFIIRHADVVGAIDIKQDLQAVFLMDDAEVMVEKIRAQVLQEAGELFPEKGGFFIICDNGVDVNDGLDPELAAETCFQLVCEHVGVEKRHVGWHLQMEGHHPGSGAVVMDDEIMHSKNMIGGAHGICNFLHKLRIRLLAKERAACFEQGLDAGHQNEDGDGKASEAVDRKTGYMLKNQGEQYNSSCDAVISGIAGRGFQCYALKLSGEPAVVAVHIELHQNGTQENRDDQRTRSGQGRVHDFPDGFPCQLKAHEENGDGDKEPGKILDSAVPEGVSGICFVACKSESDERDNAAPCIGEVVQGVGDDGD